MCHIIVQNEYLLKGFRKICLFIIVIYECAYDIRILKINFFTLEDFKGAFLFAFLPIINPIQSAQTGRPSLGSLVLEYVKKLVNFYALII